MRVEVIRPHGFCAGVTSAVQKALSMESAFCLHEPVHNELVVGELKARGFRFVEAIEEVPDGATVLFSAHGVSPAVRRRAVAKGLKVVDATCPFVARVHAQARDLAARGLPVVIIGRRDHAEVKGIRGEIAEAWIYPDLPSARRLGVVSQTTMDADEVAAIIAQLRERYEVETSAAVCGATRERQEAVRAFCARHGHDAARVAVLVLGSVNSSNTRRLAEIAESCGLRAARAGTADDVAALDFAGVDLVGLTSGASTPESFFNETVAALNGRASIQEREQP